VFVSKVTINLWVGVSKIKELFFSMPAGHLPTASQLFPREIAVAHSLYNLLMVIIWLPLVGPLARFLEERINDRWLTQEEELRNFEYLNEKVLNTPALALRMAAKEILRTAQIATDMLYLARIAFIKGQSSALCDIGKKEDLVDELRNSITLYLSTLLSRNVLTASQSRYLAGLIHVVNDVERIADHAENIGEFAKAKFEEKLPFSQLAINELELLYGKVLDICKKAISTLEEDDPVLAKQVLEREEAIDKIKEELRQNHINRLNQGRCWPGSGIIYLEMVANLERVADHAANIAQVVLVGKEEMS
jgi:phosphate:Na+ symporter